MRSSRNYSLNRGRSTQTPYADGPGASADGRGRLSSEAGFPAVAILFFALILMVPLGAVSAADPIVLPKETDESIVEGYVGLPVAAFEAMTASGRTVSTADFKGRALIIDLWGLNCVSCLEEMRVLEQIYRDFSDDGLAIWALNTEMIGADRIMEGLEARGIDVSYDLLVDPDLEITKTFTRWFIPVTIIVDSHGIVQYYKVGFKDADAKTIRAKVGVLLEE